MNKWDTYFFKLCCVLSEQSSCMSRQIGCVIAEDKRVISTGYNGPPERVPHCGKARFEADSELNKAITEEHLKYWRNEIDTRCPRHILGFESGQGLNWCPAAHAEQNAIVNAARTGARVFGATLYLNTDIPCKSCLGLIINAGIVEVVALRLKYYDNITPYLVEASGLKIRNFEGELLEVP